MPGPTGLHAARAGFRHRRLGRLLPQAPELQHPALPRLDSKAGPIHIVSASRRAKLEAENGHERLKFMLISC